MSAIEFEEESSFKSHTILGQPQVPKIVNLLTRMGIVKDEKQAQTLVLSTVLICLLVSIILAIKYVVPKKSEITILKGVVVNGQFQEAELSQ